MKVSLLSSRFVIIDQSIGKCDQGNKPKHVILQNLKTNKKLLVFWEGQRKEKHIITNYWGWLLIHKLSSYILENLNSPDPLFWLRLQGFYSGCHKPQTTSDCSKFQFQSSASLNRERLKVHSNLYFCQYQCNVNIWSSRIAKIKSKEQERRNLGTNELVSDGV